MRCARVRGQASAGVGDLPERDKFSDQGGRAFPTMRSHVRTAPEVVRKLPGQIRQGKRSRNSRTKAQADQATCAFLLVGGEAARRRLATGRAVRPLGGLGWGMRLRWPWLGIAASFREDDLFEGEICRKSGVFHRLGKNSSEEGKAACGRRFADKALLFCQANLGPDTLKWNDSFQELHHPG